MESERRGAIYNLGLILKKVEQRNGLQNGLINIQVASYNGVHPLYIDVCTILLNQTHRLELLE